MERTAANGEGGGDSRLSVVLRVAASLLVLGFLVAVVVQQWGELQDRDVRIDPVWLAAAVPALLAFYALAAHAWALVLRSLGSPLPAAVAQSVWAQSLLARYVPGGVLMVLGRVVLAAREGVPARVTAASLVYEVSLLLASATLVGAYALVAETDVDGWIKALSLLSVPLIVVLLDPRVFGPISSWALRVVRQEPLAALIPLRTLLGLLALYLGIWLIGGLGMFLAGLCVYPLELGDLPTLTAAFAIGFSAAALLIVFPGGLGVRDAAYAGLLGGSVGGFATGATIAIAGRLVSTLVEVLYAGVAVWLGRRQSTRGGSTSPSAGDP